MPQVTPQDVKKAMDAKSDFVLLDVRTEEEYGRGKLEGSINVPVDTVIATIESVIPDKSKTVYVYCLSGSRSVYAVKEMLKLGYTHVFDMEHGLLAWRVNRYPVVP